jgi:hypothetical protein
VLVAVGVALAAAPCALALILAALNVAEARPHTPWEAAIVADGWRAAHGLAVYEPDATGHATAMYGPAEPVVLGALFRVLPVSKAVPQLLSLAGALALCTMALATLWRRLSAPFLILVALTLVAIDDRVGGSFSAANPDLAAWALGFGGVLIAFAWAPRRPAAAYLAASACIVLGFLFKQPVAALAVIFPIVGAIEGRGGSLAWLASWLPALAVTATSAATWAFAPTVFQYMFVEPASYPISSITVLKSSWRVLGSAACLWLAAGLYLTRAAPPEPGLRRRRLWCGLALVVTLLVGTASFAKLGGADNSFVPAWFTIVTFSAVLLVPQFSARWRDLLADPQAALFFLVAACAFAFSVFPDPNAVSSPFGITSANIAVARGLSRVDRDRAAYSGVIAYVRVLNGRVLSPDDPTIMLYAKAAPGRSWVEERDALDFPRQTPGFIQADLARADFIVSDTEWWEPRLIAAQGFTPIWSNGQYLVWRRRPARAGGH